MEGLAADATVSTINAPLGVQPQINTNAKPERALDPTRFYAMSGTPFLLGNTSAGVLQLALAMVQRKYQR
jgi:hypothetical protein